MSLNAPSTSALKTATDAVVDYALRSLEPQFLCWTKEINMQVAEFVWNCGGINLDPRVFHAPGGDLPAMVRKLCRARRKVPREVDEVMLLGLDVHHERGEMLFTFDLSWDEGESFQPCRIVVDHSPQGDGSQN